jgi:hypothetical protein
VSWREQAWLSKRLQAWIQAGLLDPSQAQRIEAFELERRRRLLDPAVITGLFAALCAVLGVILIISHHWAAIPAWTKQSSFLLLTTLLFWLRSNRSAAAATEALDAALVLWPLAGIGLWAQIYQLSGDPSRPLLTAAVLGLPVVWWGASRFAAFAQAALAVLGLFLAVHSGGGFAYHALATPFHWEMQVLLWSWLALLLLGRERLTERGRALLLASFYAWLYSLVMLHGFRLRHQSCYYMAAAGSLLLFWGTARFMRIGPERSERDGAFWLGLLPYVAGFGWWGHDWMHGIKVCPTLLAFPGVVATLGALAVLFMPLPQLRTRREAFILKVVLLACYLPGLTLALTLDDHGPQAARVMSNLLLGSTAVYWMVTGVERGERSVVNRGIGWLALLLVTRFLDLLGSMLTGGLGFLVAALLLGGLAWGLEWMRRRLLNAAGGAS